ncbi:M3 family metallopeptidase [Sphingomonas crocodyli]|uniref:oligopeptidase A n=1 Tax=Sphingomonas crocodyli TaxID=1979270 RepID=A0A437M9B8_9SPHN|nr:M3 family metallopeptidase [Sphingomonas crocodyli]RVT94301.1 M3 family peptidase [Sphingomonas crocodyli]
MNKMILAAGTAAMVVAAATAPLGAAPALPANPLLAEWTGPNGGVPAFDKAKVSDFKPAIEAGIEAQFKEVDAITANPAAPTFDNTIVPLEKAGRPLSRALTIFFVYSSNLSSPEFQKVEEEVMPKLAAAQDRLIQNAKLFARIDAIYNSPDKAKLTPEQQRLVWKSWNDFNQAGAKLSAADKAILSTYNQKLAALYTKFAQNQLADEENYALVLDNKDQLRGLTDAQIAAASADAEAHKLPGKWRIANTRSAMEPFVTYATDRALREKGWRMWVSRGDNGNANDNNALVVEILKVRAQKAKLLGYPTYAHWHLADTMAKTPDNAMNLLMRAWKPAVAQVHADVAEMQKIADADKITIEPWDYRFYAEKLRKAKYDLDLGEVKPYLQLDHVRDAMFMAAGKLYGYSFAKVDGLPVYHPDVTVYEVKGKAGNHIGYWYFDPFARAGKQSGAWMNAYREQSRVDGDVPTIVSNNSNFIPGGAGQPTTISWDDAATMFHEFGHALHGLSANSTYPSLSGTNTARDFVEFPSQVNENWFSTPEVQAMLVNAKGEQIPAELLAKIKRAQTFNQGFSVVETQASAIVDMKLHLAGDAAIDPKAFEKATLAEIGMPKEIVMRHRIPQFGHIFAGEGYAAGYYGYLWAEVLATDAYEAFGEAGSPYDPATAKRFHDTILSVGNTVDPAQAFRNFRGRDPKVAAWLRHEGFPVTEE